MSTAKPERGPGSTKPACLDLLVIDRMLNLQSGALLLIGLRFLNTSMHARARVRTHTHNEYIFAVEVKNTGYGCALSGTQWVLFRPRWIHFHLL